MSSISASPPQRFADRLPVQTLIEPERDEFNDQQQHNLDKEVIADGDERQTATGDNRRNERREAATPERAGK